MVLAFTMSYLPFLLMALEIADTTGDTGLDIMLFWEILLAAQVLCVWVIFPILIVYYESNENDGARKKIKRSMQVAMPMFLTFVLITVPTYFWLSDFEIPKSVVDAKIVTPPSDAVLDG